MNRLKLFKRLLEARMTPRKSEIRFKGHDIHVIYSLLWNDVEQQYFNSEIALYFGSVAFSKKQLIIVDAGAASGLFSLATYFILPASIIWAFEPSKRLRILLARNVKLN